MQSSRGDAGVGVHLGWLAAGLVSLVLFVLAWRGTWRNWVDYYAVGGASPLWAMPGFGAVAVVYGGGRLLLPYMLGAKLLALTLLPVLVLTAIGIWDPAWFGPAWYREFKRRKYHPGGAARAARAASERDSERMARDARRPRTPSVRRLASLLDPELHKPRGLSSPPGVAIGHLLYYDDELVFAAERFDDAARPGPTIRSIPADTITGVEIHDTPKTRTVQYRFATLKITTDTGAAWRFECIRAHRAADDVRRLYLGTRR